MDLLDPFSLRTNWGIAVCRPPRLNLEISSTQMWRIYPNSITSYIKWVTPTWAQPHLAWKDSPESIFSGMKSKPAITKRHSKISDSGRRFDPFEILVVMTAISSLLYFPFIFDGYSLPKLLVISLGLTILLFNLLLRRAINVWGVKNYLILSLCMVILLLMALSTENSKLPFLRSAFGAYGRGNGIFYYISVLTLMVLAMAYSNSRSLVSLEFKLKIFSWILVL